MTAFAQGEIYARSVTALSGGLVPFAEKNNAGEYIISHSESGNHHLLGADGVQVFEKPSANTGLRILYAIVDNPTRLYQDAAVPHGAHDLANGIYEFRISREFDPLMQQVRRVAD